MCDAIETSQYLEHSSMEHPPSVVLTIPVIKSQQPPRHWGRGGGLWHMNHGVC